MCVYIYIYVYTPGLDVPLRILWYTNSHTYICMYIYVCIHNLCINIICICMSSLASLDFVCKRCVSVCLCVYIYTCCWYVNRRWSDFFHPHRWCVSMWVSIVRLRCGNSCVYVSLCVSVSAYMFVLSLGVCCYCITCLRKCVSAIFAFSCYVGEVC